MRRCLQLAELGIESVAPNPMVGAVLVFQDRIIAEGYHAIYGGPHAEVDCLNKVREEDRSIIEQSTLYVSLEPCDHHGKTPPCTDLILQSKIPRVVIGAKDVSEKVNGKGVNKLREHGVEVVEGCLEQEATEMNRRFFTFHRLHRPYVILKWAQSSDGFIGKAEATTKISNAYTDKLVHQWRSEEGAILVGTQTALTDNPLLTVRHREGKNPLRVLLDLQLKVPDSYRIFNDEAPTLIFNRKEASILGTNTRILISTDADLLYQVMQELHQRNILSLIVEGGARTLQTFIAAGLWDEARIITNPSLMLQEGISAPVMTGYPSSKEIILQEDKIRFIRNTHFIKSPH
jgi:diaminohydroxyphosphoribosylaminopyrimidine deaminase/5-amino-6-(5-phosphoribosylamino)uracil reductase